KLGKDAKPAAGGVTALATSTDKAAKAGARAQPLAKGAGTAGSFGPALAATRSQEVAKILEDPPSAHGAPVGPAGGGYNGPAAVLTGNQEALKNARNEYRGTVNDFKKWASATAQSALNGASGVERLNDALLRAIKGTEKGPRKVTWIDRFWGTV